jgi:ubiquinone/menaquinone biosynthesis C-methylase UbiE
MKQWNEAFKKHGLIFTKHQENIKEITKLFKDHKVRKILDLGCGSGRHTVYFVKNGFDVYGIDIADKGIKLAKEWLKKENLKAIFKVGNIYEKLPYNDNFFDAVISTGTLHHERIENIRKAIREIERVLVPGGLIFITFRKRKFKKFYPKQTIIERYGKQRYDYKVIAPRTWFPNGANWSVHYSITKN